MFLGVFVALFLLAIAFTVSYFLASWGMGAFLSVFISLAVVFILVFSFIIFSLSKDYKDGDY